MYSLNTLYDDDDDDDGKNKGRYNSYLTVAMIKVIEDFVRNPLRRLKRLI